MTPSRPAGEPNNKRRLTPIKNMERSETLKGLGARVAAGDD